MSESKKAKVLFVCLGNICRSPLAEVVVKSVARERGIDQFHFESAGTGSWHVGGPADPRSAAKAQEKGLDLSAHRAQQITPRNVDSWDWFVAMDSSNRSDLLRMGVPESRLLMMRQFENDRFIPDVPDPYYGGPDGFEDAYWMLKENAGKLLDHLEAQA
ncbi:protein tyrosine phosphatase [Mariprofundus ferrinatatus]|uniref:protein-tyrosine-phosphatase n=1 Tax=Mariprofundus ferrinatatus TaxID=1921087 RepID=A0A2K8L0X0_9PROT|nr:low molecular weight protein-tyrosine-phosphatase [Mariprofundus ferrinatatus]ATX80927.1 protein tyrosine phosphatase [Mariprofundus ferrinatatus]